jgi:hypothetical protein
MSFLSSFNLIFVYLAISAQRRFLPSALFDCVLPVALDHFSLLFLEARLGGTRRSSFVTQFFLRRVMSVEPILLQRDQESRDCLGGSRLRSLQLPDLDQARARETSLNHRNGFGQFQVGSAAQSDKLSFEALQGAKNYGGIVGQIGNRLAVLPLDHRVRKSFGKLADDGHPAGRERVASKPVEQSKGVAGRRAVVLGAKGSKQFGLVPVNSAEQVRINQANRDQPNPAMRQWLGANPSDAKLCDNFIRGSHRSRSSSSVASPSG